MTFLSGSHVMVHASKMFPSMDKTLLKNVTCCLPEIVAPGIKDGCHSSTSPMLEVPSVVDQLWQASPYRN